MEPVCSKCHLQVLPVFYFCPNCGRSLRSKPMSMSVGKQIGLYALSFFLPPLGLWPGFKYLFQKDPKAKIIGGVAVLLTIISLGVTLYYSSILIKQLTSQVNSQLNGQINNQINSQINSQVQNSLDQLPK